MVSPPHLHVTDLFYNKVYNNASSLSTFRSKNKKDPFWLCLWGLYSETVNSINSVRNIGQVCYSTLSSESYENKVWPRQ